LYTVIIIRAQIKFEDFIRTDCKAEMNVPVEMLSRIKQDLMALNASIRNYVDFDGF
jgi:hypothetical protein